MSQRQHEALEVRNFNDKEPWEACRLGTRATPSPGPSEVLVKVKYSPVNPSDILCISGEYMGWKPKFPAVPGLEGMGVVAKIGENVSNVSVGQRVVPLVEKPGETGQGLWQEYIVAPYTHVIPIPDTISDEIASMFIINPWTAIGMFRILNVPKGEYILQTAAASVLGRMFTQYAYHQGVKTINIVRRNEQIEELKALGADEVLNSRECDVVEKVKQITGGKMAYAAIECVGGKMTKKAMESVRNNGTVLMYGILGASFAEVPVIDVIFRSVKLEGFWLSSWLSTLSTNEILELAKHTWSMISQKVMHPLIGEIYTYDNIKEAIKKSLQHNRGGKVLLASR